MVCFRGAALRPTLHMRTDMQTEPVGPISSGLCNIEASAICVAYNLGPDFAGDGWREKIAT